MDQLSKRELMVSFARADHTHSDSIFKSKLKNTVYMDIDNLSETLVTFNLNYLLNSLSIRVYDYELILFSYYGCFQFDWYLTDLDRKNIDRNFLQINFKCILISQNGTSDIIIKKKRKVEKCMTNWYKNQLQILITNFIKHISNKSTHSSAFNWKHKRN